MNTAYVNPDTGIREVQDVLLEILTDVGACCEKHGLRYTLYCGTLLGAMQFAG